MKSGHICSILFLSLHSDIPKNGITKEAASHFFLHVLVVVRGTSFGKGIFEQGGVSHINVIFANAFFGQDNNATVNLPACLLLTQRHGTITNTKTMTIGGLLSQSQGGWEDKPMVMILVITLTKQRVMPRMATSPLDTTYGMLLQQSVCPFLLSTLQFFCSRSLL